MGATVCAAWTSRPASAALRVAIMAACAAGLAAPLVQGAAPLARQIPGPEAVAPTTADTPSPPTVLSDMRVAALRRTLVGSWSAPIGKETVKLRLKAQGHFSLGDRAGTYQVGDGTLVLTADGVETTYRFQLPPVNDVAGDQLELAGADLDEPVRFTRESEVRDLAGKFLDLSPSLLLAKAYDIGMIIGIVVLAWLLIQGLQALSEFAVCSAWGPLAFLYRAHKHRTRTLHSLVLNLCKYVVYFTALGLILTELGVNYTAYLASLSVIGLAIGFGSQGLVQDMVTGFFVIFENQYDVGDMVEVSGQTGVVEELGLRMTRLRNYVGQGVVIPNRNIGVVGNYRDGAQLAWVDVAVRPEDAASASARLKELADEVGRQFSGVVMRPATLEPAPALAAGEQFVRVCLAIWPQQTWVIDQELVPRVRAVFQREGREIPANRIATFYHGREQRRVAGMGERVGVLGQRLAGAIRRQTSRAADLGGRTRERRARADDAGSSR